MRYPAKRKEAILRKVAPPMGMTVPELAEQEGISLATVYNWRKEARAEGRCLQDDLIQRRHSAVEVISPEAFEAQMIA